MKIFIEGALDGTLGATSGSWQTYNHGVLGLGDNDKWSEGRGSVKLGSGYAEPGGRREKKPLMLPPGGERPTVRQLWVGCLLSSAGEKFVRCAYAEEKRVYKERASPI